MRQFNSNLINHVKYKKHTVFVVFHSKDCFVNSAVAIIDHYFSGLILWTKVFESLVVPEAGRTLPHFLIPSFMNLPETASLKFLLPACIFNKTLDL